MIRLRPPHTVHTAARSAIILLMILLVRSSAFSLTAVRGQVIDDTDGAPVSGAGVTAVESGRMAASDGSGRFVLPIDEKKDSALNVSAPGYRIKNVALMHSGTDENITVRLRRLDDSRGDILVTGRQEKQTVSRKTVEREELRRMPGAAGDALRGLQSLPGVAVSADYSGELYVRGNGPYDNRIFLDGFWIYQAYHFGGFVSIIPTDIIDDIDFYAGGFPARYGEATGSVLDITTRERTAPGWGGRIDINLLSAGALIEGSITDRSYFILAGRRSYFELYARPLIERMGDVEVTVMPAFWDYQGKIGIRLSEASTIELLAFGSGDRAELAYSDSSDVDVDLLNRRFGTDTVFHVQGLSWKYRPSSSFRSDFRADTYTARARWYYGEYLDADVDLRGGSAREDLSVRFCRYLEVAAGLEFVYAGLAIDALVPVPKQGAPINALFPEDYNFVRYTVDDLHYLHYGGYIQTALTLGPVRWVAGVRGDIHQEIRRFGYVSPRTSLEIAIGESDRIFAATGIFRQAQDIYFTNDVFGNPDLTTQTAVHYIAGFTHDFGERTALTVEGYCKKLSGLIVAGGAETFVDDGTGRVYGGEVLLRRRLVRNFFGWMSYGYSVSKRDNHDGRGEYFFEYDRTHIVNLIASWKPLEWFQVGFRWRYASGLPVTAITGSVYDAGRGEYLPVYSQDFRGERLPSYHKLDIRFDFFADWFDVRWDLYIEILNACNHNNVYQQDFNQREPYSSDNPDYVYDLPLIPYFGIEVRF